MKILIVKLGSIGDVVHTLPAAAAIRRALPEAEIAWAVERRAAEVLRGRNQILDRLIELDTKALRRGQALDKKLSDARRQFRELRRETFDVAIDFQGLIKSAVIARIAGAEKRYGFARAALREPESRFLLTDTIEVSEKIHVIRKNLLLARAALGIDIPERDFEFPIAVEAEHVAEAEKIVAQTNGNFAILNPAGGWVTKLWQAEKFGRLADRLWTEHGLRSIVTTAPNETELAARVLRANVTGSAQSAVLSLKGFYELTKRAAVYVGGDTGPTHLAVAANAPVVGIFGPTEWWRNGSPREEDICVERTDIGCRINCHRRKCDNWICLDISVEAVARAVALRLEK